MKNKQLIIFLAGGLGNQLFQLSAGMAISNEREIVGELGFSGPRNPESSHPVIEEILISQNIRLNRSRKLKVVTQKIFDILISASSKTNGFKSKSPFRYFLELVGTLYFSFYYKKIVHVTLSKGLGFYDLPRKSGHQILIGYFQSYKYSNNEVHKKSYLAIEPTRPGSDYQFLKSKALIINPIMVHLRLGDYLAETKFGIPSIEYYVSGVESLRRELPQSPIWVFTDEIEQGKTLLAEHLPKNIQWVGEVDNSIGSTLSLFRYGAGYVIANSSFSWWAAWSRSNRAAKVFYPIPWFVGLETPQDLTPPDWESLPGHLEE